MQGAFIAVIAAATLAGAAQATQAVYNNAIAKAIGGTLPAALISMIVAACMLTLVMIIRQAPMPNIAALQAAAPYPLLVGGTCGAIILMCVLYAVPALGSAPVIVLFILGQLVASICLDHFGVMGLQVHPVSLFRLAGIGMVLGGAVLVIKG